MPERRNAIPSRWTKAKVRQTKDGKVQVMFTGKEARSRNPERQEYEIWEHHRGTSPVNVGGFTNWAEADKRARELSRFAGGAGYWFELRPMPYEPGKGGSYVDGVRRTGRKRKR